MPRLYDLAEEFLELERRLTESEGADEAAAEALDRVEADIAEKADGYYRVLRNLRAEIEPVEAEIERLQRRKAAIENAERRLKDRLAHAMHALGMASISTDIGKIGRQYAQATVDVTVGVEALPERFVRRKPAPDPEPDKKALKEALEAGDPEALAVANLVPGKPFLRLY